MSESKKQHLATLSVHAGQEPDPTTGSRAVPIYQTTSYVFKDADHAARLFGLQEFGNIYTRIMNPTTDVFEKRLAALEGGAAALATASGQAAETLAITTLAGAGDEIVSTTSLYGGTYNLFHYTLPRLGITVRFVDADDFDGLRAAINPKTRAVYTETLGNPKLDIADIEKLAGIAHQQGVPLMIDNTAALPPSLPAPSSGEPTSWSSPPPSSSAATAPRSAASSSTAASSTGKPPAASATSSSPTPPTTACRTWRPSAPWPSSSKPGCRACATSAAALSPFNAFLFLQGLETLHLRMERHSQNALAVAKHLANHPGVDWVNYPGLPSSKYYARAKKYMPDGQSSLVTFGIKGGYEAGKKLINSLKLFSLLANIGDAKSLVIHPASTTHSQLTVEEQRDTGVTPELVRLSVGIEDVRDILADLNDAIEVANGHSAKPVEELSAR